MPSGTLDPGVLAEDGRVLADQVLVDVQRAVVPLLERGLRQGLDLAGVEPEPAVPATLLHQLVEDLGDGEDLLLADAEQVVVERAPGDDRLRGVLAGRRWRRRRPADCPAPRRSPACLLASAARATAGPPVTTRSRTPLCSNRAAADSSVGGSMIVSRSSIPIASRIALLNRRTPSAAILAPDGWALKTTVLPAASMLIALPARVGRLCVTGVIAPMTPNGA